MILEIFHGFSMYQFGVSLTYTFVHIIILIVIFLTNGLLIAAKIAAYVFSKAAKGMIR